MEVGKAAADLSPTGRIVHSFQAGCFEVTIRVAPRALSGMAKVLLADVLERDTPKEGFLNEEMALQEAKVHDSKDAANTCRKAVQDRGPQCVADVPGKAPQTKGKRLHSGKAGVAAKAVVKEPVVVRAEELLCEDRPCSKEE